MRAISIPAALALVKILHHPGWYKITLVKQLGLPENSVRRLLGFRHNSRMRTIEAALANAELSIDPPKTRARQRAA